jgi:membrane-bound lytic murein transglycosylase B
VGIPVTALAAYGSAELTLADEDPGCHLSWVALAGIGAVESDHGRFGGAALLPDGRSRPPIIGIPLDGNGVAMISDTDRGHLDGDPGYDRAVGPMQFLPGTWRSWGADGDGDGRADPFVLADAALAAGRYLCHGGGGDLRTVRAWSAAVLGYNASTRYLRDVTRRSNLYAARSVAP